MTAWEGDEGVVLELINIVAAKGEVLTMKDARRLLSLPLLVLRDDEISMVQDAQRRVEEKTDVSRHC